MNQFEGIPGLDRSLTPEELEAQEKAVAKRGHAVESHDFSAERVVQKEDRAELRDKKSDENEQDTTSDIMRKFGSNR